ncbi:hypothetical protein E0E53_21350 [Azotobacter chroococcum]|nr:hypothetical protein E0E53_21350 [Azotobacter chroococcum]
MSNTNLQLGTVDFHGQTLAVITGPAGERLVAMKPICEAIGLDWKSQYSRIQRNQVLKEGMVIMTTPSPGGEQETTCLPLDYLNGWLFGVDASRVKPEIRERLVQYQRECFAALAAYWQQGEAVRSCAVLPAGGTAAPLRLTYNDRHFRIVPVGTEVWFVAPPTWPAPSACATPTSPPATCGPSTRPPSRSAGRRSTSSVGPDWNSPCCTPTPSGWRPFAPGWPRR